MSIVKFSSLVLLLLSQSSFADTGDNCESTLNNKDRTLKYFACLQENLVDAEIKAKIKEAQTRMDNKDMSSINGMYPPNFSQPTMNAGFNPPLEPFTDKNVTEKVGSDLPQYIAYSASKTSKEAIIAYGQSEVRVKSGSVLSGGWTVSSFNEYSMTVTRKNKKETIPLTIVSGEK